MKKGKRHDEHGHGGSNTLGKTFIGQFHLTAQSLVAVYCVIFRSVYVKL